jgi:hypothetical protein
VEILRRGSVAGGAINDDGASVLIAGVALARLIGHRAQYGARRAANGGSDKRTLDIARHRSADNRASTGAKARTRRDPLLVLRASGKTESCNARKRNLPEHGIPPRSKAAAHCAT